MSDSEYFPARDKDAVTWVTKFVSVATANSTMVAIPAATLSTMTVTNTEFNNSILLAETKKAEWKAAVKAKNDKRKALTSQVRAQNRFVQGRAEVTDSVKVQMGLNVRPTKPSIVMPLTPVKLAATGSSNGVNFLTWKSGDNKSGTLYEIWVSVNNVAWQLLSTETRLRYEHKNVMPGVPYLYKVRAKRVDRFSNFSDTASVYMDNSVPNPPALVMDKAA
jgi:hypothetical protein